MHRDVDIQKEKSSNLDLLLDLNLDLKADGDITTLRSKKDWEQLPKPGRKEGDVAESFFE